MRFSNVIGQDQIKEQIIAQVKSNRMPHALMFSSPPGRGKLAMALATASYIYCENSTNNDSCGRCASCNKTDKLIHPDLHFSFPVVSKGTKARGDIYSDDFLEEWRRSILQNPYLSFSDWLGELKAENRQGDINAKECREIISKLGLKSFTGKSKVLIVWKAELLGNNANRLLKLIEEPAENTYIIFLVDQQDYVLNTILSRFQIILLPPVDPNRIREHLVGQFHLSNELAEQISLQSEGNVQLANELATTSENNQSKLVLEWLRMCYLAKPDQLVDWTSQFSSMGKEQQKQFLLFALHILREIMKLGYLPEEQMNLSQEELTMFRKLSSVMNLEQIQQITRLLNDSIYGLERNMNPKLVVMSDSLMIGDILHGKEDMIKSKIA